jgi:hypothetical protein
MPIPSYTETLGGSLGPGITIIQSGDLFGADDESEIKALDINTMNAEIANIAGEDGVVFEKFESPQKDIPFQTFLAEQRSLQR